MRSPDASAVLLQLSFLSAVPSNAGGVCARVHGRYGERRAVLGVGYGRHGHVRDRAGDRRRFCRAVVGQACRGRNRQRGLAVRQRTISRAARRRNGRAAGGVSEVVGMIWQLQYSLAAGVHLYGIGSVITRKVRCGTLAGKSAGEQDRRVCCRRGNRGYSNGTGQRGFNRKSYISRNVDIIRFSADRVIGDCGRTAELMVRGQFCHTETSAQFNTRFATRFRGGGRPWPPFGDRLEPQKTDQVRNLTP